MPMACMVATAVAYHASEATSAKGLVSVRYSSRASSVSRRKKMVATSARVIFPWGFTGFLAWSSVGSPVS